MKKHVTTVLIVIALIFFDQLTKYFALNNLRINGKISLIQGVFSLLYVENRGAAFGIMQNMRLFFIILTIIICLFIGYVLYKLPLQKRFIFLRLVCIFLLAGALGNFIDRIVHGFVVDFLYFELIDFPVFNIADCYVTLSTIALFFLLVFYHTDEELAILFPAKKGNKETKEEERL